MQHLCQSHPPPTCAQLCCLQRSLRMCCCHGLASVGDHAQTAAVSSAITDASRYCTGTIANLCARSKDTAFMTPHQLWCIAESCHCHLVLCPVTFSQPCVTSLPLHTQAMTNTRCQFHRSLVNPQCQTNHLLKCTSGDLLNAMSRVAHAWRCVPSLLVPLVHAAQTSTHHAHAHS
jgi:hypothetical protein